MARVAVLAGGPSSEHEVSLLTSACLLALLREGGHCARPVWIDHDGGWHPAGPQDALEAASRAPGLPAEVVLAQLREAGEIAVLGLHGTFGEDGTVQHLLDEAGVAYTGSPASGSSIGMDKELSKLAAHQVGARTAGHHVVSNRNPPLLRIQRTIGYPCFVKPVSGGSSVGARRVDDEDQLVEAVAAAQGVDPGGRALVEEWTPGREVTCAVLRLDGEATAMPLVEIRPAKGFYDYHAKYRADDTGFLCPAPVDDAVAREIQRVALQLYEQLGLHGAARVDFIVREQDGLPVFLELNTLPGFTDHSLVPLACRHAGLRPVQVIDALLADAVTPS